MSARVHLWYLAVNSPAAKVGVGKGSCVVGGDGVDVVDGGAVSTEATQLMLGEIRMRTAVAIRSSLLTRTSFHPGGYPAMPSVYG